MSADPTIPPPGIPKTDTAAHLLVCVGPRCTGRGARPMFQEVWDALDQEKIAYYRTGGSIRLTETGCLGACDYGPTIACYTAMPNSPAIDQTLDQTLEQTLEQTWRVNMTAEKIVELARGIHQSVH
jgi:NADH:ubiquinone oxidoreductase subunit E